LILLKKNNLYHKVRLRKAIEKIAFFCAQNFHQYFPTHFEKTKKNKQARSFFGVDSTFFYPPIIKIRQCCQLLCLAVNVKKRVVYRLVKFFKLWRKFSNG